MKRAFCKAIRQHSSCNERHILMNNPSYPSSPSLISEIGTGITVTEHFSLLVILPQLVTLREWWAEVHKVIRGRLHCICIADCWGQNGIKMTSSRAERRHPVQTLITRALLLQVQLLARLCTRSRLLHRSQTVPWLPSSSGLRTSGPPSTRKALWAARASARATGMSEACAALKHAQTLRKAVRYTAE